MQKRVNAVGLGWERAPPPRHAEWRVGPAALASTCSTATPVSVVPYTTVGSRRCVRGLSTQKGTVSSKVSQVAHRLRGMPDEKKNKRPSSPPPSPKEGEFSHKRGGRVPSGTTPPRPKNQTSPPSPPPPPDKKE